ncbi:MAG: HD domain-containing protein, partial [Gammaproteobacteria bacterium]
MATQLIKHLEDCAKSDAIYKPLESQWTFDERLIAKALQNVSIYFPHYSRHDESHSRQILVHIERLLGPDNIAKLSPTDTWLLLEAAYLHDIGMIISDEQLKEDYDAIKKHVEKARYSANGDVLTVMNGLLASKEKTASSIFASVDISPFQAIKLLREIIADFYRAQHPDRANKIIPNPFDEIGLNSPRNELLPARFFSLLGKICAYHGDSFDKVMELPKQQVGIGTDDCHPRFIACLLRLGDLLDLDDNRFCPVMMKVAGKLPELSEAHRQKHLAIRHFRADPDRIEIEAECPDYESYIETTKWFGWLREEVKNQMSRWFDIVPERSFGLLPAVGDLKVHLKDWQVCSENQRPHFELDRDRIFELLQGAGLYKCKEQAMRELLQNAVDATLIRIWREHGKDCKPRPEGFIKRESAPRSEEVQNILSQYAIDVSIEKEKEEEQYNYWRITIADQGTGISRDDLKFMLQMGSSKKNHRKRAIIEKMPVWMKPSGIFGIGLHSVFLLTDEVLIETRSIDTGETLVIRMTNPTNAQEHGNVYFQIITKPTTIELNSPGSNKISREFKPWNFSYFGCRLSFIYKTDKTTSPKTEYKTGFFTAQHLLEEYDGLISSRDD